MMKIWIFLIISFSILMIISSWKIFEKAGYPGWASLIPFYNTFVLLDIIGKPWWWFFLLIIPFVNIIFSIWMMNLLSKSFGKDEGFTLGLLFIPFVFYPILGLGDAEYRGPAGLARYDQMANRHAEEF